MDESDFEPRLGRFRPTGRKYRNYLNKVLASVARDRLMGSGRQRTFVGSRIGRGSVAARMLHTGVRYSGLRSRRAIVKTRLVRLGSNSLGAARAHLNYIQRDGVSRQGQPGQLYSAREDIADGRAFLQQCGGDRHQFRLIVSAEDGLLYDDLKPLIRRFMTRMEEDLGTRLEWVAADHRDTLHPHTHIILRGKDERGENLVISPEYIKHGMRERLSGLLSIDLGPRSDLEINRRLELEVGAERLTGIDRNLLRRMDADRLIEPGAKDAAGHAFQTGRLRKLGALGLATKLDGGKWRLAENLERTLRGLGERGDVIRTMQRELKAAGIERPSFDQVIEQPALCAPIVGRIVARGLADELSDTHYLIVDGTDGRSHYLDIGRGDRTEALPEAAIVRISARTAQVRDVDHRIASVAAKHAGNYSAELHRFSDPTASDEFVSAHVRRLEAIRRQTGKLERTSDGRWSVPSNFVQVVEDYELSQRRDRPLHVEVLSRVPLGRLPQHDGATWLDQELLRPDTMLRDQEFGREVRSALAARRAWLLEQGLAETVDGELRSPSDLLAVLQRRELRRVAATIREETGRAYVEPASGAMIEGVVRRRVDLASGRFALIENEHAFALVPWRPVLDQAIDRHVMGVVGRGGSISWTIARGREIEL
jgi:type IV secretory pathway VirD2 relaxase